MNEIKEFIEQYSKLLALPKSVSTVEAERRAAEFLVAMAKIADFRHLFSEEKIKLLSIQTAVFAQKMSEGTAKTVTENKLNAEASEEYTSAREKLESLENDLSYLKSYYDIFQNSHIFYRTIAKGESF